MSLNSSFSDEPPKCFSFDYSYWSHDGYKETEDKILVPKEDSHYAGQQTVFNDLGKGLLNNAIEGYNCSLFAYGQTGSGKSYSMIGYGPNKGIVPIACDELFKRVNNNEDPNLSYEVSFSMMEIYNEQVRDLLTKENPKGGLQVRQNPKMGMFFVEGLQMIPVGSYNDIQRRMEQGTANRTVASTNMNATSSRAHTVVTIVFDQILKSSQQKTRKSSVINLVDLAGSERVDSTGATGDRLREGANINKSLSALGNVISALADLASGKKKVLVPYRDSVLTKLLKNALGGNSRTVMIAALSPADINYEETLSTLRYADRAKKIKNNAVINENPMDKLLRELREENDRLRKNMESRTLGTPESFEDAEQLKQELENMRAQLFANQKLLSESTKTWEEKLAAARSMDNESIHGDLQRQSTQPHLINLNEDPMLSRVVFHYIDEGKTTIGSKLAKPLPKICLNGLSIQKEHAAITYTDQEVSIEPTSNNANTKVNGLPLTQQKVLNHMDRILFGSNHLYLFINPFATDVDPNLPKDVTWEFAQKEIAKASGYSAAMLNGLTKEQQITQEKVLEILPMVSEVNAVSDELNKHKSFEVVLMPSLAICGRVDDQKSVNVMVKMKDLLNENTWLWERGRFMNRRYLIQELYQKYQDGEDVSQISKEDDPFWEAPEDTLVGTANVFLQSLSYCLEFEDRIIVADYKGTEEGFITVNVAPCSVSGNTTGEDTFVEDPKELLEHAFHFKVMIKDATVYKDRFCKGLRIRYRTGANTTFVETDVITGTLNPVFNHSKIFSFHPLTEEHLNLFQTGCITFWLFARQNDKINDSNNLNMTTRELRQKDKVKGTVKHPGNINGESCVDNYNHLKTELILLQKRNERLTQKERRIQQLCVEWSQRPEDEQQYEPFWRAISAVAKSTGTKFRTNVRRTSKGGGSSSTVDDQGETISLYIFGEDEQALAAEAKESGGIIDYSKVVNQHCTDNLKQKINLTEEFLKHCSEDRATPRDTVPTGNQEKIRNSITCAVS